VTEFFGFSINNILYQRGIYPPESFTRVQKYGLPLMVTSDEGLTRYLAQVLTQLSGMLCQVHLILKMRVAWLLTGSVQKLVVVIASADSGETLERWTFDIETDAGAKQGCKAIL